MDSTRQERSYTCESCAIFGMNERDFIRHIRHAHANLANSDIVEDGEVPGPSNFQLSNTRNLSSDRRTDPLPQSLDTERQFPNEPLDLSISLEENQQTEALDLCIRNTSAQGHHDAENMEVDVQELIYYKSRLCSLCGISFAAAGMLDVHKFNCHPEIYNDIEQVGAGAGIGPLDFIQQSAFENGAQEHTALLTNNVYVDIQGVFLECRRSLEVLMQSLLEQMRAYLVKCLVMVEMTRELRDSPGEFQIEIFPFRSYLHTCLEATMIPNLIRNMRNKVGDSIKTFLSTGSGWKVHRYVSINFKFVTYRMDRIGQWIPTPKVLEKKKCVINIRNHDDLCFKYAIKAELYPVYKDSEAHWYRVTNPRTYENIPDDIDWECITFPMTLNQMDKFLHFNSKVSVNVYGYEEIDELNPRIEKKKLNVFPLFVCKEKRQTHVDLLLVIDGDQSHFMVLRQSDENPTEGLSRLLGKSERHYEKFVCQFCLHYWSTLAILQRHESFCITIEPQRVSFPEEKFYTFRHIHKTLAVPFVIYCDFKCILSEHREENTRIGNILSEHIDCGYSFSIVGPHGLPVEKFTTYCGPGAAKHLLKQLILRTAPYFEKLNGDVGMDRRYSAIDLLRLRHLAEICVHCSNPFENFRDVVVDHCHVTGYIRGASCNSCNLGLKLSKFIPIVFHNLKSYDSHFLVQSYDDALIKAVQVIPATAEKFTSMQIITHENNCLKFIDSFQFMTSSLADQVDVLAKEDTQKFRVTRHAFAGKEDHFDLLFQKGIYPYSYMTHFGKFLEEELPSRNAFRSDLTNRNISEKEYLHAVKVWNAFQCKTLKDYHNLYVTLDTCLLADCFQNLRSMMIINLRLDPAHYVTLPGIAYDAAMLVGHVQYDYLKEDDMYMYCERGIRGGICSVGKRYAKANNPYMGNLYNPNLPTSYLVLWDANLLYSTCLRNFVPYRDFRWDASLENREQNLQEVLLMLLKMEDECSEGLILEVDLDYPAELHDAHNDFPLAVERCVIDFENLSSYTREIAIKSGASTGKKSKLAGTFYNKRNYVIHYRLLKLYLRLGLKLVKVHRALRFKQAPLFRVYTDMCIKNRRSATSKVEQMFWKNMGNVLFGKLLQNVRKFKNINIALTKEKMTEYAKKPTVKGFKILHENCVLFMMKKLSVRLDKQVAAGMTILDDSKVIMYNFFYNILQKKYGHNMRLVMTDTDSFLLHIHTEDVYKDVQEMMKSGAGKFDTSNFDPSHHAFGFLSSQENQGKGGYFKDEYPNSVMTEAIALKPKLYSVKTMACDGTMSETKKAKGTVRAVVQDQLHFSDYKQVLDDSSTKSLQMTTIRSLNHKVFTTRITKQSLSALEDKSGFYISPTESLKFGHYRIAMYEQEENVV